MTTGPDSISEKMREVKHLFMTYRNGIVADTLRKAGMPYGVIFGLQIPQINEIARIIGYDPELARALWNDTGVRESRLLACRLFPDGSPDEEEALRMMLDVATREEADFLAFALLRRRGYAISLVNRAKETVNPENLNAAYTITALERNLAKY